MNNKVVEYSLKLVLLVAVVFAAFKLYGIIREPILAEELRKEREKMVINRLEKARDAQKAFKDKYQRYTASWDSLTTFLKKDSIMEIQTKGDPNDTTQQITRDTSFIPAQEALIPDFPPDSIASAPMTGKQFKMDAGKIKLRGVDVHVFEIKDVQPIIDDKVLKVGSMKKGNTSGNW